MFEAQVGSLKYFLTARYYFYTADTHEKLYRGEIEHTAWPLQPAKATIQQNSMTNWLNIHLPDTAPLLHFVRKIEVVVWPLQRL